MIIDEMGFFWWDHLEETATAVPGHLSIDEMGAVSLEMHGNLDGQINCDVLLGQTSLTNMRIRGELKKSGKKILLTDLSASRAVVARFSYVNYDSSICYVSHDKIQLENLSGLRIPLVGLEGWFIPGKATFSHDGPNQVNISMSLEQGDEWALEAGSLFLATGFEGKIPFLQSANVNVGMTAWFEYRHNKVVSANELLEWFDDFSDFISLLTKSTYTLRSPSVTWINAGMICSAECYFYNSSPDEGKVGRFDIRLPLMRIKSEFGKLLQSWFDKKRSFGPAINLYLGAIKNHHLYAEHTFVNMIWGLESLDRRKELISGNNRSEKINSKSERIIKLINEANILKSSDKRWLSTILNRSHERSLAERLYDVISPVVSGFNVESILLRQFCKECADLRNDLSHHGGERTPGESDSFIDKLIPRMYALEELYPLIIFNLIGLEESQLAWITHESRNSYGLKMKLKQVGLLTDEQFTG